MRYTITRRGLPRSSARGQRPDQPPSAAEEISVSAQAHDGHFLERTIRCEGRDLDRAMRLYHHAPIVKQLLKELVAVPHQRGRLAIPLRDAGPSPHVIITETGAFVTCLSEEMSIADLPVLPYGRFVAAMDRADQDIRRCRVRRQQLLDLPWKTLYRALYEGPGHVTREMIEIFDRDPETYLMVIVKAYAENIKFMSDRWIAVGRANYAPRKSEILGKQAFGRVMLCLYLMAFIDAPIVLDVLAPFVILRTGMEMTMAMAMVRHPEGGQRLLDLLEKGTGDDKALRAVAISLLNGCMLQPAKALALCRRFCSLPLRYDGWELVRVTLQVFLSVPEDLVAATLQDTWDLPKPAVVPASKTWLFSDCELLKSAFWHRAASLFFPPAAQTESVKAAWAEALRETEEWHGFRAENAVPIRKEARVGRNDPCPCGSGKKHKQCCLGKPTGPTAEEQAAAEVAAREKFVEQTLQSIQMARTGVAATGPSGGS